MEDVNRLFERNLLLNHCSRSSINEIKSSIQYAEYNPDDIVFRMGEKSDGVYIIIDGMLQVYTHDASNDEIQLAVYKNNNIVGSFCAFDNSGRSAFGKALERLKVAIIPNTLFVELLRKNPDASMMFIQDMINQLRNTNNIFVKQVRSVEALFNVQARIISLVANIQPETSNEFHDFYLQLFKGFPIGEDSINLYESWYKNPPSRDVILDDVPKYSHDIIISAVKNAYLMCSTVGIYNQDQKEVLDSICCKIGIKDINALHEVLELYVKMVHVENSLNLGDSQ